MKLQAFPSKHFKAILYRNLLLKSECRGHTNAETTREEDISYSLMGIVGVFISPIYGEGKENAFLDFGKKSTILQIRS
jgi:hypothetical protein